MVAFRGADKAVDARRHDFWRGSRDGPKTAKSQKAVSAGTESKKIGFRPEKNKTMDSLGPIFDIRVRERSNISFSARELRPQLWGAPGGMRAAAGGEGGVTYLINI